MFITLNRTLVLCLLVISASGYRFAHASEFETTISTTSTHLNSNTACETAFSMAERQARLNLSEPLRQSSSNLELVKQSESREKNAAGETICTFQGTWTLGDASANRPSTSELSIDGEFTSSCWRNGDENQCWKQIRRQAEDRLRSQLRAENSNTHDLALRFIDFEGTQTERYRQNQLEITVNGRFYFTEDNQAIPPQSDATIEIHRQDERHDYSHRPSETSPARSEKQSAASENDDLDVVLSLTWDGNGFAAADDLAISSHRWSIGLWSDNRIGVAAFKGTDRLGIADSFGTVINSDQTYDTFGVGLGVRLLDNRSFTLENMLYYVDAQPAALFVDPDCFSGCTSRDYQPKDYLQTTVNLKTNNKGVNIGWMLTWKLLEDRFNVDTLSSGLYLDIQL